MFSTMSAFFDGWLDCYQHYTKTTELISVKLGWRMDLTLEQTLLTFGMDPGTFSHFL